MPWVEIEVVDEQGRVPWVKVKSARGYSVMQGYWTRSERRTIDSAGWLPRGILPPWMRRTVRIVGRIRT